jgi:DNA-binding XRE family transcriptional regulator
MPIIGQQCTRDGRTVCLRMSEAALPVNYDGPGLTLVLGWSNEERRAQGTPASLQGIEFGAASGKLLPLDFCPWCGAKLASNATTVRAHAVTHRGSDGVARVESTPLSRNGERPAGGLAMDAVRPSPPVTAPMPVADGAASLKAIRLRLGISQLELGQKLGLARSSLANYENGRAPVSQRIRKWIAKHEGKPRGRG